MFPIVLVAIELSISDLTYQLSCLTGFAEPNNSSIPLSEALNDQYRVDLHRDVLQYVLAAIRYTKSIQCSIQGIPFLRHFFRNVSWNQWTCEMMNVYVRHKTFIHCGRNGSDIRGYFIWTLLDDFEVLTSYTWRFGLHYVDFNDNLKRYPKLSAHWYRTFLQRWESRGSRHEAQMLLNSYTSMRHERLMELNIWKPILWKQWQYILSMVLLIKHDIYMYVQLQNAFIALKVW